MIISKVTSNRATSFTATPWWTQNWYLRLLIRSSFSYNTWSHTTSFAATFRPANYVDFFVWEYDGWMFIRRHIKSELDNIFGVLDRDIMTEVLVRAHRLRTQTRSPGSISASSRSMTYTLCGSRAPSRWKTIERTLSADMQSLSSNFSSARWRQQGINHGQMPGLTVEQSPTPLPSMATLELYRLMLSIVVKPARTMT